MKEDKIILEKVKEFLEDKNDISQLIDEICEETGLLIDERLDNQTICNDEMSIFWEDEVCDFDEFIRSYTNIFIDKMCNVLDSFIDENVDLCAKNKPTLPELPKAPDNIIIKEGFKLKRIQ